MLPTAWGFLCMQISRPRVNSQYLVGRSLYFDVGKPFCSLCKVEKMPKIYEYPGILVFSIPMNMNQFMSMLEKGNLKVRLSSILRMAKL